MEERRTGEEREGRQQEQGAARKKVPKRKEDSIPSEHHRYTDNEDEGFDDMDDVEPASPDERPPTRKPHKHGAPRGRHSALPSSSSELNSSNSDYHVLNPIKGGNQRVSLNHYIFVVT